MSAASNCYGPSLPRDCDLLEEIDRAKNQFPPSPKTILNILEALVRRTESKPESAKPPPSTINTSDIIFEIEAIQDALCGGYGRVMDCIKRLNDLKRKLRRVAESHARAPTGCNHSAQDWYIVTKTGEVHCSECDEVKSSHPVVREVGGEAHRLVMDIMEHSKMSDDSVTAGMKAFERLNNYYLRHKDNP